MSQGHAVNDSWAKLGAGENLALGGRGRGAAGVARKGHRLGKNWEMPADQAARRLIDIKFVFLIMNSMKKL